jgi:hypothetical protein
MSCRTLWAVLLLSLCNLTSCRVPAADALPAPQLPDTLPFDDDDDLYDDLDDADAPRLDGEIEAQIRAAYRILLHRGDLQDHRWHFKQRLPPLPRLVRLSLGADEGITDGYARFVLVPVDDEDQPQGTFYLTREGGFAGSIQWLGPYAYGPT